MEEIEFEEYGDIRKVVIEGYHVKYIEKFDVDKEKFKLIYGEE